MVTKGYADRNSKRLFEGERRKTVSIKLNHTIVFSRDKEARAALVAEILGLSAPTQGGPFLMVKRDTEITRDFCDADREIVRSTAPFSSAIRNCMNS
jgi:hypothetical protein